MRGGACGAAGGGARAGNGGSWSSHRHDAVGAASCSRAPHGACARPMRPRSAGLLCCIRACAHSHTWGWPGWSAALAAADGSVRSTGAWPACCTALVFCRHLARSLRRPCGACQRASLCQQQHRNVACLGAAAACSPASRVASCLHLLHHPRCRRAISASSAPHPARTSSRSGSGGRPRHPHDDAAAHPSFTPENPVTPK